MSIYLAKKISVFKFDNKIFKAVIVFSLPLIPANISAWVMNLSDRIFIERYFELSQVGIYSMGYQIATLVNFFGTSIMQAYDPWFYKQAKKATSNAMEKIREGNNVISIIVLFLVFSISLFSKEAISILLNYRYAKAYIYVPIVALAVFWGQIGGLINLSFYQSKKTFSLMWVVLAGSLINLMLNFILIRRFGAIGAAWATLMTFVFEFILKYNASKRFFRLSLEWATILKYLVIMSVIVIIGNYYTIIDNVAVILLIKLIVFTTITAIFYYNNKGLILNILRRDG